MLGVSENDMSKEYELTSFNDARLRNNDSKRPFKRLVFYLKTFPGETLQEKVTNWAKGQYASSVAPLTDEEIQTLKSIMLK